MHDFICAARPQLESVSTIIAEQRWKFCSGAAGGVEVEWQTYKCDTDDDTNDEVESADQALEIAELYAFEAVYAVNLLSHQEGHTTLKIELLLISGAASGEVLSLTNKNAARLLVLNG